MTTVVLDASATGPLFLNDETSDALPGLARALSDGGVLVPAHWLLEVGNLIRLARIRDRLDEIGERDAMSVVQAMTIEAEPTSAVVLFGDLWELAVKHKLTIYDASYLELALRTGSPLATNDKALMRAAMAERVELFGR